MNGITAQSNSLARILSSTVKAEIFRLLFGQDGRPLSHVRELERRSGLANSTVGAEQNRLKTRNLIAARTDGNRGSYAASAIP